MADPRLWATGGEPISLRRSGIESTPNTRLCHGRRPPEARQSRLNIDVR